MDISQHKGSNTARLIWIVSSPIICTLGVLGNLMTIIVLTNKKCKKTSSTIFLTVLAFADLIMLTVALPRWWIIYLSHFDVRHLNNMVCKLHWFLTYWASHVSTATLASLTIERTICTVRPYKVKTICTVNTAVFVSVAICVIYLFVNGHLLFGLELFEVTMIETSCENISTTPSLSKVNISYACDNELFNLTEQLLPKNLSDLVNVQTLCDLFDVSRTICDGDHIPVFKEETITMCWFNHPDYGNFFSGPFQVISHICYEIFPESVFFVGGILIVRKLQLSKELRIRTMSNQMRHSGFKLAHGDQATQITRTLLLVNVVFVVTTTPAYVFLIGRQFWISKENGMTESQEIVWAIINQLFFVNHACNFILYFLSGSRFRKQVLETFRRKAKTPSQTMLSASQTTSTAAINFIDIPLN